MKKNIEIEEAFKIFESSVKDIGIEKISISKGLGYILAEDIFSPINQPPFSKSAMYGATIGKIGILTFPATTNQACCACEVFNGIDKEFLFLFLLSHREEFVKMGGGGAQPNISKEKIINTYIPLPPFAEQKRIVNTVNVLFTKLDDIMESL